MVRSTLEGQQQAVQESPRRQTLMTREDEQLIRRTARRVVSQHGGDRQLEDELYHYGMVGLLEAKKSFDREKGIPFAGFAVHRIRGAMVDYLRRTPMVKVPQKKQDLRKQLQEAREELRREKKEDSTDALARRLGWSLPQVRQVASLSNTVVSLAGRRPHGAGERDEAVEFDIADHGAGPEWKIMRKELARVVQHCLDRLRSARDRLIVVSRIVHERKLREVADSMGCSLETIRLRQQKAQASLRRCLDSYGWDEESLNELTR